MWKKVVALAAILLLFLPQIEAIGAEPEQEREKLMEEVLLQQLHPILYPAIQRIYNEQYPQYTDAQIVAIDGAVTGMRREEEARRANAIGGAKIFKIMIALHKKGAPHERVLLTLDNDTPDAKFAVKSYEIESE